MLSVFLIYQHLLTGVKKSPPPSDDFDDDFDDFDDALLPNRRRSSHHRTTHYGFRPDLFFLPLQTFITVFFAHELINYLLHHHPQKVIEIVFVRKIKKKIVGVLFGAIKNGIKTQK